MKSSRKKLLSRAALTFLLADRAAEDMPQALGIQAHDNAAT